MQDLENGVLKLLPIGGLGEIGMNMMVVAWGRDAFIIDSGLLFPDESMPGVDLVIPDLEPLLKLDWNILGIVLTHGHEDHIGALPYVLARLPVPVYATELTMGLAEHRLEEFGLIESSERCVVSADAPLELGPFHIDLIDMCHSVPDGVGLAVRTPAGLLMHSGDFKLDPTPIDGRVCDVEKISSYADGGVLALLSDSTNAEHPGQAGSEILVRPSLERIFREAPGRIFIATFSSNIHRIQQVLRVAEEFGRKVVLVGRSMVTNTRIASERGYLDIPRGILIDLKDMDQLPDERVTILSTGSQGEPMSALSLMAYDRHKYLTVKRGDLLVLSSRFIPGNEKDISQIINEFFRRGALVEYEKISHVHVSGHACQDELRAMLRLVRPRYFIPVHGEYRHLVSHAHLAIEEGIPRERVIVTTDGDLLEISHDAARVASQVQVNKVFVDGKGIGDVGNEVLRDRRVLSEVGLLFVALVVDRGTGRITAGPEISSIGVTYEETEPGLIEGIRGAIEQKLAELSPCAAEEWDQAKEEIRLAARRYVNRILGRKPLVQTVILYT